MKKTFFCILTALMVSSCVGLEKKPMKPSKWFEKIGCEKLRIVEYASAGNTGKIRKEATVTDPERIKALQIKISQLPPAGQIMAKMGPEASYLVLEFSCGAKSEKIEFYEGSIKTPDTSFYAQTEPLEEEVWAEIQLLFKQKK